MKRKASIVGIAADRDYGQPDPKGTRGSVGTSRRLYAPQMTRAFWQDWSAWEQGNEQRSRTRKLYVGSHLLAKLCEVRTVAPHIWGVGTFYGLEFAERQQTTYYYYKTARRALQALVL